MRLEQPLAAIAEPRGLEAPTPLAHGAKWRNSRLLVSHGTPSPALNTVCASDTNLSISGVVTSWSRRMKMPPGRSIRRKERTNGSSPAGVMWCRPM